MHSSNHRINKTLAERALGLTRLALAMAGIVTVSALQAQVTSVPSVVFSSSSLLGQTGSGGSANRIAANQRGDIFTTFSASNGSLIEVPAGTTTQVVLATNLKVNDANGSVTVDPHGNVWFLAQSPDGYDDGVDVIPFANGTYASGLNLATASLPACALPANKTTVPCVYPNIDAPTFAGGYTLLSDLAVDAAGDLYALGWVNCFLSCTDDTKGSIVEYNATTGVPKVVENNNLPNFQPGSYYENNYEQFVVAPNGDIYAVNGINLYYSAAGTGTVSTVAGFNAPSGVSIDGGGNIYVADTGNNRIAVLPNINGTVTPSSAYTILSGTVIGQTPYFSVGIDGYGTMTYPVTSGGSSFYKASVGGLNFGSIAVGSTSTATDLDLYFTAPATYGSVKFTSGASTSPFAIGTNGCVVGKAYAIGATCSLTITYKASAPGPQNGSLEVFSQAGTLLGTARLSGSGTAPLLNVDPGTVTAIGSGWTAPSAIATDGAGNTYVADSSTGDIYKNGATTPVATGFKAPSAVVVDGVGNLYVGDSGNSRIMEVPYSGTAYGTPVAVVTGLSGQSGLAIDASGNLYVADSGNGRVLLLSAGGSLPVGSNMSLVGSSVSSTGGTISGFTKPVGVAADSQGNVYVADSGNIIQVSIKKGTKTTIAQALTTAAAVAVDPGGNLYYADSGAQTITRVPNIAGTLTPSGSSILSTAASPVVATPVGLALDASGNLYAVDSTDATVGKLARTAGILSYGNVVKNTPTPPSQTATLSNGGTSTATLSNPYEVQTGSADFTTLGSSTCANSGSLTTGNSCNVVEQFDPTTYTLETASITFGSNAAIAPTLSLNGTGVILVNASFTPATDSVVYGAGGTVSVSVTPNVGTTYTVNFTNSQGVIKASTTVTFAAGGTTGTSTFSIPVTLPVGSYTVSLVGTVGSMPLTVTTATLVATVQNATRQYGFNNPPFTCSFTGILNGDKVNCVASVANTVTATSAPGAYTIIPSAVGTAAVNYTIAPAPPSTFGTLTITQATPSVSIKYSATVTSIGTILVGSSVTFSSTVGAPGLGTPTGSVTFEDATLTLNIKILGTEPLNTNGPTTFTTTQLLTGTIDVEACYSGDTNFAAACSAPTGITISNPSFTIGINPTELIIKQGQFGTAQLTIMPVGNYTAPIVLECGGLPLETTCAFAPSTVTLTNQAAQTVTLLITTTGPSGKMQRPLPWGDMGGGTALALMAGIFVGWRRKRFKAGLYACLLVAMFGLLPITGCSGLNERPFDTPLGTYTSVAITGSSSSTGTVVTQTMRVSVTN
jgi:sugar lactone lactonase YvrE